MQQPNRVRTYLDPDAVGPLPRSALADDSDALAAARTIVRRPHGASSTTLEIAADDFIEVVDPNRKPSSIAPVGIDSAIFLPRHRLGRYVVAALAVSLAVLVLAALESIPSSRPQLQPVAVATPSPRAPDPLPVAPPMPPTTPPPASTIGTLRLDTSVEAQRVFVDGVALQASAALLRCGPHEVAMGSGHTRTIEVPCGGEVTVYR
jgi:hypothetical protein